MINVNTKVVGSFPRPQAPASEVVKPDIKKNTDSPVSEGRDKLDTIELSEGGQKIVNLQRGVDLAEEIRNKPVDQGFAKFLSDSLADINRIANIFRGTVRSLFAFLRQ